jgi:hypothetical protein
LFAENYNGDKLAVASIKTVIGHTEGTAGVASVIGTMLALKNHVIPQNLHFHNLNPSVALYCRNLEVSTTARSWTVRPGETRRPSVNKYAVFIKKGFHYEASHNLIAPSWNNPSPRSGGENARAIMKEYIPAADSAKPISLTITPNLQFTP